MKATATDLATALAACEKLTTASAIPILAYLLVEPDGNTARLTATNMQTTIRIAVPCVEPPREAFVLPAQLASKLIAAADKTEVVAIEPRGGTVAVSAGFKANVGTLAPEDFPKVWKDIDWLYTNECDAEELNTALAFAANGIDEKEHRAVLRCACLDGAMVTGTDGKLLFAHPFPINVETQVLVPLSFIDTLARNIREGALDLQIGEREILATNGTVAVRSTLQDGKYPDVEAVVAKQRTNLGTFNVGELRRAIRAAAVMADERNESVVFERAGDEYILRSASTDHGQFETRVAVEGGEGATFAHRAGFALAILKTIESDRVTITAGLGSEATSPHIYESMGDGARRLLMPIKLADLKQQKDGEQ